MEVCVEYVGCREIRNLGEGDIEISMSGDDYDASCPFERDDDGNCTTSGYAEIFDNYLNFMTDSGSAKGEWYVRFIIQPDGRLCWVPALQNYDVCMPLNEEYYKPTGN